MLLCTRCKKRPAVVFVSNGMDSQNPQGLCLVCAKELGIKPVNDIMEKMGITDEELEDCRRGLLSGMNGVEDSLGGMETWYYIEVLRAGANSAAPIQTPAQARAALQAVTKEDVRSILRQLTLSVSYLLTKEEPTHA